MNTTLTAQFEGLRLEVYDDADGRPVITGTTIRGTVTLGYGLAVSLPYGGIDNDEADFLLVYRLWKLRRALAARFANWSDLSETRRAVLADVAYNRGLTHFDGMNLKASVERGDFLLVAKAIGSCPAAHVDVERYATLTRLMADDPTTIVDNGPDARPLISDSIRECIEEL